MTILQELKAACAKGRDYVLSPGVQGCFGISGGWAVHVEAEYNTPRGGPMAAWKYLYYLVPQTVASGLADMTGLIRFAVGLRRRLARPHDSDD